MLRCGGRGDGVCPQAGCQADVRRPLCSRKFFLGFETHSGPSLRFVFRMVAKPRLSGCRDALQCVSTAENPRRNIRVIRAIRGEIIREIRGCETHSDETIVKIFES